MNTSPLPQEVKQIAIPLPPPCLRPVETMKRFCLEQMTDEEFTRVYHFQEHRLEGEPQSSTEMLALFHTVGFLSDLFWITDTCCLAFLQKELPEPYTFPKVKLWTGTGKPDEFFWIYAATFEDAVLGVNLLEKLGDTKLQQAKLFIYNFGAVPSPFPLPDCHLLTMTQKYSTVHFSRISFTAVQCYALLLCTQISLSHCMFTDGGAAILKASSAYAQPDELHKFKWKFVKLYGCIPFDDQHFSLFLKQRKLFALKLYSMRVKCVTPSQTFVLALKNCMIDDGGSSLFKSIQEATGPRGIHLWVSGADSYVMPLLHVLWNNTYLQRLVLAGTNQDICFWRTLAAALRKDQGLINLHIWMQFPSISHAQYQEVWDDLMEAFANHPELRCASVFCTIVAEDDGDKDRIYRTKALARMLERNCRIEDFSFNQFMYDRMEWNATVDPKLKGNLWRQRSVPHEGRSETLYPCCACCACCASIEPFTR